jgi:hypothetical protein
MKKLMIVLLIMIATVAFAQRGDYSNQTSLYKMATIGKDGESSLAGTYYLGDVIVTGAVLTYASTSELAFTLDNGLAYYPIEVYGSYVLEVKVTYNGNPADVNLTIGQASSSYALTAANAISQLDSDYWVTEVIDLDTSGTGTIDYYLVPDALLNGKYIYFKYQYSGDPDVGGGSVNDPTVELKLTRI